MRDDTLPVISNVTTINYSLNANSSFTVNASVSDNSRVDEVTLWYRLNNNSFDNCPVTTYSAENNFSSTQGYGNWYYQEWTGSAYQNMNWDSGNNRWQGTYTWNLLWGSGGHSDSYETVRTWESPSDGTVNIFGNAHKTDTGCAPGTFIIT